MYQKLFSYLFFLSFLAVLPMQATVYSLTAFSKGDRKIVIFGDYHASSPVVGGQKRDVVEIARELKARMIVEDPFDRGCLDEVLLDGNMYIGLPAYGLESVRDNGSFLNGLKQMARSRSVPVQNIEFRHFMYSDLSIYLRYMRENYIGFHDKDEFSVKRDMALKGLHAERSFFDSQNLRAKFLDLHRSIIQAADMREVELLNSEIFDYKLSSTIERSHEKMIFVCTGAKHGIVLSDYLSAEGWIESYSEGMTKDQVLEGRAITLRDDLSREEKHEAQIAYFNDRGIHPVDLQSAYANFRNSVHDNKFGIKLAVGTLALAAGVAYACYHTSLFAWAINNFRQ